MKATIDQKEKMKEYYLKNKEKINEKHKKYYHNNKQNVLINRKKYYENNKEKIAKRQKEYNKEIEYKNKDNSTDEEWKTYLSRSHARKKPLKENCDICGSINNLQRHHWDYNRPLLVNTLCKDCHSIQHIKHFNKSAYGGNSHF